MPTFPLHSCRSQRNIVCAKQRHEELLMIMITCFTVCCQAQATLLWVYSGGFAWWEGPLQAFMVAAVLEVLNEYWLPDHLRGCILMLWVLRMGSTGGVVIRMLAGCLFWTTSKTVSCSAMFSDRTRALRTAVYRS